MTYIVPPFQTVALPIVGSDQTFPVDRVFCVGRNYLEHAREMGADERDPPFFFLKGPDSIVYAAPDGEATVPYPPRTANYHHEIELVLAIGKGGKDISIERATDHIIGYAVGLDMTRRDLQQAAREKGRPWDTGKNFEQAAPCGPIHLASAVGHLREGSIWLEVNGQKKQSADLKDLIWNIEEIVEDVSKYYTLRPGDLIFTGTPAGVGAVKPGDVMRGHVDGLAEILVKVGG